MNGRRIGHALLAWLFLPWLALDAQQPGTPDNDATQKPAVTGIAALKSLRDLIDAAGTRISVLQEQLAAAPDGPRRAELETQLATERAGLRSLNEDFREVASGVEEREYTMKEPASSDLSTQVNDLLQPLLGELRDASSGPREMEALRNELRQARARQSLARQALERIRSFAPDAGDDELKRLLDEARQTWQQRAQESGSRIKVLELQIAERERSRTTFVERASSVFSNFWRTRGLNLLLAFGAALATFLIGRRALRFLRRFSPLHRRKGAQVASRLANIIAAALLALLCLMAALIMLYVREDWVLLTLAAIILLGIVWAGRSTLPPYIEQIRLLLNIGPVREGERIIIDNLPWRVSKLGFYSQLTNPELNGGSLRVPARDLLPLRSRPFHPREPWFPTRIDDWVILADGTYGKVVQQTPEQVVLVRLGGSLKTYPAADFLEQAPENLSRDFRISTTFGIDYRHQADCTEAIPRRLATAVEAALLAAVGHEHLRSVKVELEAAGASSLDYAVLADFSGEVASRLNVLTRLITRTCVDTCNAEGWVIPFTQLTVHQAGE